MVCPSNGIYENVELGRFILILYTETQNKEPGHRKTTTTLKPRSINMQSGFIQQGTGGGGGGGGDA